jgi:hypothetical protein
MMRRIKRIDWSRFVRRSHDEDAAEIQTAAAGVEPDALEPLLAGLLDSALEIHQLISDSFLSHQTYIAQATQPPLHGL